MHYNFFCLLQEDKKEKVKTQTKINCCKFTFYVIIIKTNMVFLLQSVFLLSAKTKHLDESSKAQQFVLTMWSWYGFVPVGGSV